MRSGKPYTFKEFHDHYVKAEGEDGVLTRWKKASPEEDEESSGSFESWGSFESSAEGKKCCKQCNPEKSIPCGNGCIAKHLKFHKGKGCACGKGKSEEL